MRILHLNAGNETGGGMHHILSLLSQFDRGEVVLGVFEEGEMLRRAQDLNIETVLFKQSKQHDFSVLSDLVKFINQNSFSFVHTHGPRATFLMALMKWAINPPLLTTIHSDPRHDFLEKGLKGRICYYLNRLSFKAVDHFIVVSSKFSKLMQNQYKIPQTKISTILNGINFNVQYEPYSKEEMGFDKNAILIAMVARIEPVKQPLLAIKMIEEVIKEQPNVRLMMIGTGIYKGKVEHYIKQHNLTEYVYLLGHRDDVQRLIVSSDLLLLTSKSESFPLVLLEAARAKVPIITTDVGDVKKLIPSTEYGWVVNQDNQAITEIVQQAIKATTDGTGKKKAKLLYQFASSKYSLKQFSDSVRQIYENVKIL
ncbi:glycosyltransferase family 4 protein [Alkalibacillus sp. S2W]|uniref:glycosyltransferase family 4 protein n=1 Tax=Alkalibacillus sp. S2W TaxID=3386553 RepID=UPI00398CB247